MISIKTYNENDFNLLLEFCKKEANDNKNHPASSNMWVEKWETDCHNLPFILTNTTRFSENGQFYFIYDNEIIIGCGGVYVSDFSPQVALAGVRTWIAKPYRNYQYIKDVLLPKQREWAISRNVDIIALTFNDYNSNLRKLFSRGQKLYQRSSDHLFSRNYNTVDYRVIIQGTPQWVIYEQLTENTFDWNTIRVEEDCSAA